jgi:hypothetical protein
LGSKKLNQLLVWLISLAVPDVFKSFTNPQMDMPANQVNAQEANALQAVADCIMGRADVLNDLQLPDGTPEQIASALQDVKERHQVHPKKIGMRW